MGGVSGVTGGVSGVMDGVSGVVGGISGMMDGVSGVVGGISVGSLDAGTESSLTDVCPLTATVSLCSILGILFL